MKEYLKTGEVPNVKHVFRSTSRATFGLLIRIIENNWSSVDEIAEAQRTGRGAIYNKLRELKLLGLLSTSSSPISLAPETRQAYEQDNLAYLIRNRVRKNGLVSDVLDELTTQGKLSLEELTEIMQNKMLILDVSPETWLQYAKFMSDWLRTLQFVVIENDTLVPTKETGHISNRSLILSFSTIPSTYFLPSSYINGVVEIVEAVGHKNIKTTEVLESFYSGSDSKLVDCIRAGLVHKTPDGSLYLTEDGMRFLNHQEQRSRIIRDFLLQYENIIKYLELISVSWKPHLDVLKFSLDIEVDYTDTTWEWRSKTLANWLEFAGLIIRQDGTVQRSSQMSLWD